MDPSVRDGLAWRAVVNVVLFSLFLFPLAGLATAGQASAPATIVGQVTDESGGVLPGVSVTATSPALQVGEITAVTDEQGEYRISPLPVGLYVVEYSLSGFGTIRLENVRMTIGFTGKLDQVLKVGTLAETVTVSGASPLVDVMSGATTTQLTKESVDLTPTSRDGLSSFMALVPGVRGKYEVGGSGINDSPVFRIYGQSDQSWQMLEGVFTSDPGGSGAGNHYEFNAIEGVTFQTTGNNAEMPKRGMLIDSTLKSGGNELHGNLVWAQSGDRLQADNVDAKQRALGVTGAAELKKRYDISGTLGGKVIQNKLWYFVSLRDSQDAQTVLGAFYPDGKEVLRTQEAYYWVGKTTWQMSPQNQVLAFRHRAIQREISGASAFVAAESRQDHLSNKYKIQKIEFRAVRGNALTYSLQYGVFQRGAINYGFTDKPATRDVVTLMVTGDHLGDGNIEIVYRKHGKGTVTAYKTDMFGRHEFKAGFDTMRGYLKTGRDSRDGTHLLGPKNTRKSGNYQLVYSNSTPFQLDTFNYPAHPTTIADYFGVYGQDAWTIGSRLTLNLGVRYGYDSPFIPERCRPAGDFAKAECYPHIDFNHWHSVVGRAHAAYDLFGNGKTAIKGGYGNFAHIVDLREISPHNPSLPFTTTWRWTDLNGDRLYQTGEVNLDPNGPDFVSFGNLTNVVPNMNLKQPKADEFSVAFEHQLMSEFAVRVAGVYARNFDLIRNENKNIPYSAYNIPITNRDPGPDNVLGNADDTGNSITYYDFPRELAGARFATTGFINDPKADTTFRTIELAATKRLSHRWQFSTSYVATKRHIPFGVADSLGAYTPNAEINTTNDSWEWTGKLAGAVVFPGEIVTSMNFENRSGEVQARQVLFRGGSQVPTFVANVEPLGSIRLPSLNSLDFRVEKRLVIRAGRVLELRLDVFNMLNQNVAIARTVRAGSTYLVPTSIALPRIAQVGAQFTF